MSWKEILKEISHGPSQYEKESVRGLARHFHNHANNLDKLINQINDEELKRKFMDGNKYFRRQTKILHDVGEFTYREDSKDSKHPASRGEREAYGEHWSMEDYPPDKMPDTRYEYEKHLPKSKRKEKE